MVTPASELPPFWSLVERHGDELLAYARRLTGQDAEDVLQEALLRALRSYPRLSHGRHLRAWLFRITTTTAWDQHAGRGEVPTPNVPDLPALEGDGHAFASLIEPLPEKARSALQLRFVEDLSYDAIAVRLGCSPAAARQRVSSGVRALRGRLTTT